MPTRPIKGAAQINAELPVELLKRLKQFTKARGETIRYHLELAVRRHLDNPPPPRPKPPPLVVPPLPPLPPPKPKRKKK